MQENVMRPRTSFDAFKAEATACTSCGELIGLCKGLIADGDVNQAEAEFLLGWLERHPDFVETFPGSVLAARLAGMLHDGHLDAEESAELVSLLHELTGDTSEQLAGKGDISQVFDRPLPPLAFDGQCFCLTGAFVSGRRSALTSKLADLGARVCRGVAAGEPCCVVVGSLVSEGWRFSDHGRTLEAALALRLAGEPVTIVSEEHLWNELLRHGLA